MANKKQKGFNYAVVSTKEDIVNVLNASALPIKVMEMVLGEILFEVQQEVQMAVRKEKEEFLKEEVNPENTK